MNTTNVKVIHGPNASTDDDEQEFIPNVSSMSLDELAAFVDGQLGSSHKAQQQSLLQSHKSALHLFWAGSALSKARELCDAKGHGEWKKFKSEHSFADTTANDAIRLFKNAKTPDALIGLGVTEAKKKYVYPPKDESLDDDQTSQEQKAGSGVKPKSATGKKTATAKAGNGTSGHQLIVIDPAESVAETLEDIAQRLIEVAQDSLGKVDLAGTCSPRLLTAVRAVEDAITRVSGRINNDISHS